MNTNIIRLFEDRYNGLTMYREGDAQVVSGFMTWLEGPIEDRFAVDARKYEEWAEDFHAGPAVDFMETVSAANGTYHVATYCPVTDAVMLTGDTMGCFAGTRSYLGIGLINGK